MTAAGLMLLLFVGGTLAPLADPDLPMHLAVGEWILRHRALPVAEPFAWTRAGAPFYAYSWLLDVSYALLYRAAGALGLHLLYGALLVGVAGAMLVLARAARWAPWTGILLALVNVCVVLMLAADLRPQLVLAIAVPIAWACAYRLLEAPRIRWWTAALVAASALAANTHLLFPLTAAPWMLLAIRPPHEWRRAAALVGGTVAGWLLSPYAPDWPAVYRLNFAPNPLFAPPTPIVELWPGVMTSFQVPPMLFVAVALALLPWALARLVAPPRERAVAAAVWLVGLLAFSYAARALMIWWLTMVPFAATAVEVIARAPKRAFVERMQTATLFLIAALFVLGAAGGFRGRWHGWRGADARAISTGVSPIAEPIAEWLDCHTRREARGRLFTTFTLGGYFIWRLPQLSSSIDSRNIFPDSVAKAEAYHLPSKEPLVYGPWSSAELAIASFNYPVTAVLDTAAGWRRVAVTDTTVKDRRQRVGLWVTDQWWARAGLGPAPTREVLLPAAGGSVGRGDCAGGEAAEGTT